ncbi:hypothetical protein PIB30_065696 [Stylosanthes scabra]|uniref:UspA domain-containing protein n=1 Tax=Stylosanthes scabra TaxID=79078 RepID=A0ABU6TPI5_9FABA|nr:hypothetical protein [Stylosanthes scabra]
MLPISPLQIIVSAQRLMRFLSTKLAKPRSQRVLCSESVKLPVTTVHPVSSTIAKVQRSTEEGGSWLVSILRLSQDTPKSSERSFQRGSRSVGTKDSINFAIEHDLDIVLAGVPMGGDRTEMQSHMLKPQKNCLSYPSTR